VPDGVSDDFVVLFPGDEVRRVAFNEEFLYVAGFSECGVCKPYCFEVVVKVVKCLVVFFELF